MRTQEEMKQEQEAQLKRDLLPDKSRRQRRNEQVIRKQIDNLYFALCKKFKDKLTYKIEDEFVYFDPGTHAMITDLNNQWRKTACNYKYEFGDNFQKLLRTFTDTCDQTMNHLQDRVYVPVVCRMLEEKYGIDKQDFPPLDKITEYRKQWLSANDACIRIVLHDKSIINPLKS